MLPPHRFQVGVDHVRRGIQDEEFRDVRLLGSSQIADCFAFPCGSLAEMSYNDRIIASAMFETGADVAVTNDSEGPAAKFKAFASLFIAAMPPRFFRDLRTGITERPMTVGDRACLNTER